MQLKRLLHQAKLVPRGNASFRSWFSGFASRLIYFHDRKRLEMQSVELQLLPIAWGSHRSFEPLIQTVSALVGSGGAHTRLVETGSPSVDRNLASVLKDVDQGDLESWSWNFCPLRSIIVSTAPTFYANTCQEIRFGPGSKCIAIIQGCPGQLDIKKKKTHFLNKPRFCLAIPGNRFVRRFVNNLE